MAEQQAAGMDFARRVAHFDVMEGDDVDTDREDQRANGVVSSDDIEREYLMGGGGSSGVDDDAVDKEQNACCARSCGGNDKASRVEGRNIMLGVTITGMAIAGVLMYSSWEQLYKSNRYLISVLGFALSILAELYGMIGLIGLCRFNDVDKIPFKLSYWLHLIQLWCYAGYMGLLLYLWDGNYKSGTLNMSQALAGKTSSSSSSFLQMAAATAAAVTPADAKAFWFAMQATQLWFVGITFVLILFTVLYLYGSLRMRCKRMGKWGTAMTGFLLLCLSCATIVFATLTMRYNRQFVSWPALAPLVAQMAVAALVLATCLYQMYVSTQVSKLKLATKPRFNDLLIMALVSFVSIGVCHYTYYVALTTSPRINLLYLTALSGTVSQVLLAAFGMLLLAWRFALPDEFNPVPTMERFGLAQDEEVTPFVVSPTSETIVV